LETWVEINTCILPALARYSQRNKKCNIILLSCGTSHRAVHYVFVNVSDDPTISIFNVEEWTAGEYKVSDGTYKAIKDKNGG
jgi:hypothetical protein